MVVDRGGVVHGDEKEIREINAFSTERVALKFVH
jgi:hypothetical protein